MTSFDVSIFAQEWIAAWNSRDLDAILAHYAENIEFTSPFALQLAPESGGTLRGLVELRAYFSRALKAYPELYFELLHVTQSVQSAVLIYSSVNNLLAAEMMEWDKSGQITRAVAHYSDQS